MQLDVARTGPYSFIQQSSPPVRKALLPLDLSKGSTLFASDRSICRWRVSIVGWLESIACWTSSSRTCLERARKVPWRGACSRGSKSSIVCLRPPNHRNWTAALHNSYWALRKDAELPGPNPPEERMTMRAVIDGKRYDTETAVLVAEWHNGRNISDFNHCDESLYRTKRGSWFIAGSGGANSAYAVELDGNFWGEAQRFGRSPRRRQWTGSKNAERSWHLRDTSPMRSTMRRQVTAFVCRT